MKGSYFIRMSVLVLGNLIAALGVSFCAIAGKGADPLTVLYQGFCSLTGLNIGIVSFGINVILLGICFVLDKSQIKFGTLLSMLVFSTFLEFFMGYLSSLGVTNVGLVAWFYLFIGILFMGIGFSVCIFSNAGNTCIDMLLTIIMNKSNLSMKFSKTIIDFVNTVIGAILGATVGAGTVLCVILIGVVYSKNIQLLESISQMIYKAKRPFKKSKYEF